MRRLVGTLAAVLALFHLSACGAGDRPAIDPTPKRVSPAASPSRSPSSASPSSSVPSSPQASAFVQKMVAKGLNVPLALTFAPDGRIFFAEAKAGSIRVIDAAGVLAAEPVATFPISKKGEFGLVGLAVDPDFAANRRLYAYVVDPAPDGGAKGSRVVRLVVDNNKGTEEATIIGDIPPSDNKHVAGRMTFGPDRMLYVAVGDTQRPDQAGDPNSVAGKILRVNTDGQPAPDNPFPGSRAWAVGFRNPFGIAFDPASGRLLGVDNGPSRFDEVNLIEKAGNYGHPTVFGPSGGRFKDPIWNSGPDSHGMSGITVVRRSAVSGFTDRVLFCSFDNTTLHSLRLLPDGGFGPDEPIAGVACNLDVASSPDGTVYVAYADQIVRLEPQF